MRLLWGELSQYKPGRRCSFIYYRSIFGHSILPRHEEGSVLTQQVLSRLLSPWGEGTSKLFQVTQSGLASQKRVVTLAEVFARVLSFVWRFQVVYRDVFVYQFMTVTLEDRMTHRQGSHLHMVASCWHHILIPHAHKIKEFLGQFLFWNDRSGTQSLLIVSLTIEQLFFGADACYKCIWNREVSWILCILKLYLKLF